MTVEQWLGKDNLLGIDIWMRKYRKGEESFDEWLDRVSGGNKRVKNAIINKKFVPGGRILSNRGVKDTRVTYSNCFMAGSKVLTIDGFKNIEDIAIGDMVLSHDEQFHRVNDIMCREYTGDIYCLESINFIEPIKCTPNHKFLTNHGWKRADRILACSEQIKAQDKIKMAQLLSKQYSDGRNNLDVRGDSEYAALSSISISEDCHCKVYNLSVEDTHTYNVNGVIVHNCYVIAPPEDNIESIFESRKKLARTYSYGGGCGIDISKLAPAGAKVHNQAEKTSGAVSFMQGYSQTTEEIGQNGRRGALMISLDCHHPDLLDFIDIKTKDGSVTKANISVRVTDDFMQAVEDDTDWVMSFTRPETGETITKTAKARDIFDKLCENNWNWAEPGILFWNNIENYNLLSNNPDFEYAGTNPCKHLCRA